MMTAISYSNARKNFRQLIDNVNDNAEAITITTNDHNAVLLSETDYNAIMETLYLQQSPANAKHLAQSIADLERGNSVKVDIEFYE